MHGIGNHHGSHSIRRSGKCNPRFGAINHHRASIPHKFSGSIFAKHTIGQNKLTTYVSSTQQRRSSGSGGGGRQEDYDDYDEDSYSSMMGGGDEGNSTLGLISTAINFVGGLFTKKDPTSDPNAQKK